MKKQTRTKLAIIAAICAAILCVMSVVVQAQPPYYDVIVMGTITGITTASGVDAGAVLGVGSTEAAVGAGGTTSGPATTGWTGNLYDFLSGLIRAPINITGATFTGSGGAAGIFTADATAYFLLDNITISGTAIGANKDIHGFWYAGTTSFAGEIGHDPYDDNLLFANISVTNSGAGNAYGILIGNAVGDVQTIEDSTISCGNITVTSQNDAWGFRAGDIDIDVHFGDVVMILGDITVTATGTMPAGSTDHATGVQVGMAGVLTPIWGPSLLLNTGNITVNTNRVNAFGVRADALYITVNSGFANFGTINVISTNTETTAKTAGIWVRFPSEFALDKNITVSANGGDAWGILAGDVTIWSGGNYTITVSGADNNIGVEANNLMLLGNGRHHAVADLGKVIAHGNVVIGITGVPYTVIVAEGSQFQSNYNELHAPASLKLNFASPEGKVSGFGAWDVYEGTLIEYPGTEYYFDEDSGSTYIFARRASIKSDTFLAASTIHNRYTAYTMVRDKFISGDSPCRGYYGQAPYGVVSDLYYPHALGRKERDGTSWLNYVGRADTYGNWNLGANGLQVGSDLYITNNTQFGVLFGYEGGWAKNNSDLVKSDDIYTGLYAARIFRNNADLRLIYNLGWQKFNMARDDGAYLSRFNGRTQEINVEYGKRYHWDVWSARPSIATDFYLNHLGAATETSGVGYDKFNMMQCFLRTGLDFRYQGHMFTVNSGFAFAYDVNNPDFSTMANGLPLRGSKLGREVWMYNFGAECQVYRNVSVFGGYDGQAVADRANSYQHIGYIGVSAKW